MRNLTLILILAGTLFVSCSKNHQDLITGVWEQVNVADINSSTAIDWEFREGRVSIYARPASSNASGTLADRGSYVLNNRPFKTTLSIAGANTEIYNGTWEIVRLDSEQMIIKIDITGGVIIREFLKKSL